MLTAYDVHNHSIYRGRDKNRYNTVICRNCNRTVLPDDSVSYMGMNLICNDCVDKLTDYLGLSRDNIVTLIVSQGDKKISEQIELEDL